MYTFPLKDNPKGLASVSEETVLLALDFLAVGLRIWARRIRRRSLAFNDYAIIFALVNITII